MPDAQTICSRYITYMIKILLVDENINIRRGVRLRLSLEPDIVIVGEAGNGWEAIEQVRELTPDVIVTGLQLKGMDGISLTQRIQRDFPTCTVIILSIRDDALTQKRAKEAGAVFFLSKHDPDRELVTAIRRAASNKAV